MGQYVLEINFSEILPISKQFNENDLPNARNL